MGVLKTIRRVFVRAVNVQFRASFLQYADGSQGDPGGFHGVCRRVISRAIQRERRTIVVVTVEISMYPFVEDFRDAIKEFIGRLKSYGELRVTAGPTSTVVIGDYDRVMECLKELLRWSYQQQGQAVFVTKFLPGYEPG